MTSKSAGFVGESRRRLLSDASSRSCPPAECANTSGTISGGCSHRQAWHRGGGCSERHSSATRSGSKRSTGVRCLDLQGLLLQFRDPQTCGDETDHNTELHPHQAQVTGPRTSQSVAAGGLSAPPPPRPPQLGSINDAGSTGPFVLHGRGVCWLSCSLAANAYWQRMVFLH